MSLSMSLSARYVTQSSIYDCPRLGPLTNKRIAKYQKQGYYGGGIIIRDMKAKAKVVAKQPKVVVESKKSKLRNELAKLLDLI